jgi:hypothetical protein
VMVFMLLDGDAFIHQVTGVFTRIRSVATLEVDCGDTYRSNPLRAGSGGSSNEAERPRSRSIR